MIVIIEIFRNVYIKESLSSEKLNKLYEIDEFLDSI